jgi:hypothetical protein
VIRLTDAERAAFIKAVEPVIQKHRSRLDTTQLSRAAG